MRLLKLLSILTVFVLLASAVMAAGSNRIYGRIVTVDGDEFEGLIRWDKNEASWVDLLDGNKELPERDRDDERTRERETRIEIFGISIGKTIESWDWPSSAQSGIRFGHIARLEPIDDGRATFYLKSGEQIELSGNSTDIGSGLRELVIEDVDEGEVQLVWRDIEEIIFEKTDTGVESNYGERLYGTLTTRRGDTFTGYVAWDVDEVLGRDILDGDEGNRSRKIRFDKIKAIERYSSSGATVHLVGGEELVLRGSNDVDDDNRGIIIADPAFGQVVVDWDEFDRVDFASPPEDAGYDSFDGGRPLHGSVFTRDGDRYKGRIRWDDDEEYTWEILDGDYRDISFDIEFSAIRQIERRTSRSAIVVLRDGREFRLRDSNDVDSGNKGVYILTGAGDEVRVDWDDFERVEFDH